MRSRSHAKSVSLRHAKPYAGCLGGLRELKDRDLRVAMRVVLALMGALCSACPPATEASLLDGTRLEDTPAAAPSSPARDGRDFPLGIVALTWDDGPDVHTLELAEFLARRHIAVTFFVVREWIPRVSDEPGVGVWVRRTGYRYLPILHQLVKLGHRIGSHTLHHALLASLGNNIVRYELEEEQRALDPWVVDHLRFFRAPGGAWSDRASEAMRAGGSTMIGPIGWSIDGKDWEASLYCGTEPAECEPGPAGVLRTRADVVASRYVQQVRAAGRGVALLHDRVGDVGSRYALDVAKRVVDQLTSDGYTFAAPVLAFAPLTRSSSAESAVEGAAEPPAESEEHPDLDADGQDDLCEVRPEGLFCTLWRGRGVAPHTALWSTEFTSTHSAPSTSSDGPAKTSGSEDPFPLLRFGDLNGDGRSDVCTATPRGIVCALSTGRGFARATVWSASLPDDRSFWLADVTGDARADLCMTTKGEVLCGAAP